MGCTTGRAREPIKNQTEEEQVENNSEKLSHNSEKSSPNSPVLNQLLNEPERTVPDNDEADSFRSRSPSTFVRRTEKDTDVYGDDKSRRSVQKEKQGSAGEPTDRAKNNGKKSMSTIPRTSTPHSPQDDSVSQSKADVQTSVSLPPEPRTGYGRCKYCAHCQRSGGHVIERSKTPKWFIKNPNLDGCCILMDDYDNEAVLERLIEEVGHVPGCYDHKPNLKIEEKKESTETNSHYCKQPYVVKTSPVIMPTFTPYPDYKKLTSQKRYLNEPYTMTLYGP